MCEISFSVKQILSVENGYYHKGPLAADGGPSQAIRIRDTFNLWGKRFAQDSAPITVLGASEAKFNLIVVCELYHRDGAHVPFNAGMIEVIRLAFPEEKIVFCGEESHVEQVRKQLDAAISFFIRWNTIAPIPRNTSYFGRLLFAIKAIRGLVKFAGQSSNSRLIFTSISPSTLVALKLMQCWMLKNMPVQVVSHGEIKEGVIGGRHRHPWRRFQEMRTALTLFGRSRIQYLLLEHGLKDRILQALPSLAENIEVLEHPLPPNESNQHPRKLSSPVKFGFLGVANEVKGFPAFSKLAADMSTEHPGKAEFHVIGRLPPDANSKPEMEFLTTKPTTERLSRDEYIERIKPLHFIIMPYHRDYYELSPSGTLLDAIAWQIPIIATRLPIFERSFKNYGDVGYLITNEKELLAIVESLVERLDAGRYARQVSNLHKARLARKPEALADVYREICDRGMRLNVSVNGRKRAH